MLCVVEIYTPGPGQYVLYLDIVPCTGDEVKWKTVEKGYPGEPLNPRKWSYIYFVWIFYFLKSLNLFLQRSNHK